MDINKHIKEAMLAKDATRLESLRAVKSAFLLAQTEKGAKELDEATQQKIIQKLVKQRKDAALIYNEQQRADLADDEIAQARVLETFLPEQMSQEEVKTVVSKIIEEVDAQSMADMGKVMGVANQQLAGKADGKVIASFVKEMLK